jgi:hypothetical protein
MREPLTAEDVTDEMVRELRASLPAEPEFGGFEWQRVRECEWALVKHAKLDTQDRVRLARTRIAELLNARRGK